MAVKADIKFNNGAIHRCIGRVVDRETVLFVDEADARRHVANIKRLNPEIEMEIVGVITDSD